MKITTKLILGFFTVSLPIIMGVAARSDYGSFILQRDKAMGKGTTFHVLLPILSKAVP